MQNENAAASAIGESASRPVSLPEKYETQQNIDHYLSLLKKSYPEISSAYQPSGKSTTAARIAMVLAFPVIFAITGGICFLLLYSAAWLTRSVATMDFMFEIQRWWKYSRLGLVLFLVDMLIVLVLMAVPPWLYVRTGRLFRNRSLGLPTLLTTLTSLPLAFLIFWPLWSGFSLAPTEITFFAIPVKWVIIIGALIFSAFSIGFSLYLVGQQKFCEETGVFLKPIRRSYFDYSALDSALASLSGKHFEELKNLPTLTKKERKKKTHLDLKLWGHEAAQTAYLELQLVFNELPAKRGAERTKKNWLVFSEKLDKSGMENVAREMAY